MLYPYAAKALFDYDSSHTEDLSFFKGQSLTVTGEVDKDWLNGELITVQGESKQGIFPRGFVEKLQSNISCESESSQGNDEAVMRASSPEVSSPQSQKSNHVVPSQADQEQTLPESAQPHSTSAAPSNFENMSSNATPKDSFYDARSLFKNRIAAFDVKQTPPVKPKPVSRQGHLAPKNLLRHEPMHTQNDVPRDLHEQQSQYSEGNETRQSMSVPRLAAERTNKDFLQLSSLKDRIAALHAEGSPDLVSKGSSIPRTDTDVRILSQVERNEIVPVVEQEKGTQDEQSSCEPTSAPAEFKPASDISSDVQAHTEEHRSAQDANIVETDTMLLPIQTDHDSETSEQERRRQLRDRMARMSGYGTGFHMALPSMAAPKIPAVRNEFGDTDLARNLADQGKASSLQATEFEVSLASPPLLPSIGVNTRSGQSIEEFTAPARPDAEAVGDVADRTDDPSDKSYTVDIKDAMSLKDNNPKFIAGNQLHVSSEDELTVFEVQSEALSEAPSEMEPELPSDNTTMQQKAVETTTGSLHSGSSSPEAPSKINFDASSRRPQIPTCPVILPMKEYDEIAILDRPERLFSTEQDDEVLRDPQMQHTDLDKLSKSADTDLDNSTRPSHDRSITAGTSRVSNQESVPESPSPVVPVTSTLASTSGLPSVPFEVLKLTTNMRPDRGFTSLPSSPVPPHSRASEDHSTRASHTRLSTSDRIGTESVDYRKELSSSDICLQDGTMWWTVAEALPSALQNRGDIHTMVRSHDDFNAMNSGRSEKLISVLYPDYSQTTITARYDLSEPANADLKQEHIAAPSTPNRDVLGAMSKEVSSLVLQRVSQLSSSKGSSSAGETDLASKVLKSIPAVLPPFSGTTYGCTIYTNLANASINSIDAIRAGDVIVFRAAKFTGTRGPLKTRYTTNLGQPFQSGIVTEWDGAKKKVRFLELNKDRKTINSSCKLDELKSGEVQIFRPIPRTYLGWE